jgi:hypothetical protein
MQEETEAGRYRGRKRQRQEETKTGEDRGGKLKEDDR